MHLIALVTVLLHGHAVLAVPHPSPDTSQSWQDGASSHYVSPWRKITQVAIQAIWSVYSENNNDLSESPSHHVSTDSQPSTRNDIVVRFNISTLDQGRALANVANYMFLDVWETRQEWMDLRIAQDTLPVVLKSLPNSLQHAHTLLLDPMTLQQALHDTYPSPHPAHAPLQDTSKPGQTRHFTPDLHRSADKAHNDGVFFNDYQPLAVIHHWLELVASLFSSHVRLVHIGDSALGQPIRGVRIGVQPHNSQAPLPPRKTVLIVGGAHAREWISTSTVNYLIHRLATGYGRSKTLTSLLHSFDFVLIPTLNPDGYSYSWKTDRLWRKTRQRVNSRTCTGIDLDHAFPYKWQSGHDPCSANFPGKHSLESTEARALTSWLESQMQPQNTTRQGIEIAAFLDLHSYSQQVLYADKESCAPLYPDRENMWELGEGLVQDFRLTKPSSTYTVHQACKADTWLSNRGGSMLDWVFHSTGTHFAYQIKLGDQGTYGFLMPRSAIVPSGRGMFNALVRLARFVRGDFEEPWSAIDAR